MRVRISGFIGRPLICDALFELLMCELACLRLRRENYGVYTKNRIVGELSIAAQTTMGMKFELEGVENYYHVLEAKHKNRAMLVCIRKDTKMERS